MNAFTFSVLGRGDTYLFFEQPRKVKRIVDADLRSYLSDAQIAEMEKLTGFLDAQVIKILNGSVAGILFELSQKKRRG